MTRLYCFISAVVFSLMLHSCDKKALPPDEPALLDKVCNVKEPLKELPWLQELVRKAEDPQTKGSYAGTIHMIDYEGQSYFINQRYIMSCLACEVYVCEGNKLDIVAQPEKHMAIIEQMSEKTVIYRSAFN